MRPAVLREVHLYTVNRLNAILALGPAIVYLLLFIPSMDRTITAVTYRGQGIPYEQFALPGGVGMAAVGAGMTVGTALYQEQLSRMTLELFSQRLSVTAYLAAKAGVGNLLIIVQSSLALGVSAIALSVSWIKFGGFLIGLAVLAMTVSALYAAIAAAVQKFTTYMTIGNLLLPILIFSSSAFYPREAMPTVLAAVAHINPIAYGMDVLRDSMTYGPASTSWQAWFVCGSVIVAGYGFAAATLRHKVNDL